MSEMTHDPVSVVANLDDVREMRSNDRSAFLKRREQKYIRNARIPAWLLRQAQQDLDVDAEIFDVCDRFVESLVDGSNVGEGLLFYGRPGRGKTTLALTVLLEVFARVAPEQLPRTNGLFTTTPGMFVPFADFVQNEKDCWSDDKETATAAQDLSDRLHCRVLVREVDRVKVLVLDDAGKEHSGKSGFTSSVMHRIIRARYDAGCPTIITTNYFPDEDWNDVYGEATASFIHQAFEHVHVGGKDRRK